MKVFYHVDNDGKCAAYWVKHFVNNNDGYETEYIKINYGMEFPLEKINVDEIVYIVDYSILPEEMDKLFEITKNVTWIDHHISAIERYKGYNKKIRGLRYDGIAGCMLTYCYLKHMTNHGLGEIKPFDKSMVEDAPMFTKLIADYDVWAFIYGDTTRAFQKGFELFKNEPLDEVWEALFDCDNNVEFITSRGYTIIEYRKNMMAEYCKAKGFEAELDGHKCFAVNMAMISSDDFVIDNVDDYDILVGFSFDGESWNYSLRSTKIDCSKVAMKYGGGGHKGAAGFNNSNFVLRKNNE